MPGTPAHVTAPLLVKSGVCIFGDAYLPPRGVQIDRIPSGLWTVHGVVQEVNASRLLTRFQIDFGGQSASTEEVATSVDGGIYAVATLRPDISSMSLLSRWRLRKAFDRQLHRLFNMDNPILSITDKSGGPWCVAACSGDGEFTVRVQRASDGTVAAISCDLHPSGS